MAEAPRLLLLETSGRGGFAAVAEGPALRGVRRLDEARRHARDLAPATAELLTAQGWKARDLHGVIVSRGPGSYTGLRVGIMSAKTLAYAVGCVLIGVDTFAVVAELAPAGVDRLDVLADAQQDKVYLQSFGREAGGWRALNALVVRPFAGWLAGRAADAWVSGPGLHRWAARLPTGVPPVDAALWNPQAESLLRLGLARYTAGERDDPFALEPLYLRPSAAEEQRARQGVAPPIDRPP
jgi:tRNA threonylcarbamoyladenosine biosynthesis protein TsaB